MARPLKYTARARRVRPLFETPEEEFNIQLARLIVFYEDLRIEVAGAANREIEDLDEAGKQYREMYFVRRAFATISEIRGALNQINSTEQMGELKADFSPAERRTWDESIGFFNGKGSFIGDQRNLYRGHFLHKTAKFALEKLSPDYVGVIGIQLNHLKRSARVVFKFALELVGIGLTADRENRDIEEFVHESFEILTDAMSHATRAIHALSDHYILRKFGFL
jgi:hypothetical protein